MQSRAAALARRQLALEFGQTFRCTDIAPTPPIMFTPHAPCRDVFGEQWRELRRNAGCKAGEHLAAIGRDAAESEPRAFECDFVPAQRKISSAIMIGVVDQHEMRERSGAREPRNRVRQARM